MREIKFRAWEYEAKDFVYLDPKVGFDSKWLKDDEQSTPMQYTGLHDKNGKEIYEGDILLDIIDTNNGYKSFHQEQNVEVRMDDGNYRYGASEDGWWHDLRDRKQTGTKTDLEIIGNVHEHPHLLSPNTTTSLRRRQTS